MRQEIKNLSEMCALGAISKDQLLQECTSLKESLEALKYCKEYGIQYDHDMEIIWSYIDELLDVEDLLIVEGVEKTDRMLRYALNYINNDMLYLKTIDYISLLGYIERAGFNYEIIEDIKNGNNLYEACQEWDLL